jgi:hypothetical protein
MLCAWWLRTWFRALYARLLHRPAPLRQDGAQVVADHLANCTPATAALVVDGNADLEIAKLLAAGWTWTEGRETEYVAGKRIRYLSPPAWDSPESVFRALRRDDHGR